MPVSNISLYEFCINNENKKYLIDFWDTNKNSELGYTIKNVSFCSHKEVFWKCELGHTFKRPINRIIKSDYKCPICEDIEIIKGVNDLKSTSPEVMLEWDYANNIKINLDPEILGKTSSKLAHWKCSSGHTYRTEIRKKVNALTCPHCKKIKTIEEKNSLSKIMPELLKEWDFEKNTKLGLSPDKISYGSDTIVHWRCEKGHSYKASVHEKTSKIKKGKACCPICINKRVIEGINDLATVTPELLEEWDYEKNNANQIYPWEITASSGKKVHWKCKYGHEWQTSPALRNRKNNPTGCPICHNGNSSLVEVALYLTLKKEYKNTEHRKKINKTEYDIYVPELNLLIEYNGWNWHKNNIEKDLAKYKLAKNNGYNFYCVIEYQTKHYDDIVLNFPEVLTNPNYLLVNTVNNRNIINICEKTILALKENNLIDKIIQVDHDIDGTTREFCNHLGTRKSFADEFPELAKEWHPIKNGKNTPNQFLSGSNYKAWWQCEKGHEWQTTITHRTHEGNDCPICQNRKFLSGYNDLKTLSPHIAEEWDYEKNTITPEEVLNGTNKTKYWWKCKNGHSWQATPYSRTHKNTGCPVCSNKSIIIGFNDLASTNPEILKYWDSDKNIISPTQITNGSHKKIWWIKDGKSFSLPVYSFVKNHLK